MGRARRLRREGRVAGHPSALWLNPWMRPMVGLAILLTVLFAVGWRLLSDVLPEGWAVVVLLAVLALVATCGGLVVARVVRGRSLESPEPPAGDEFEHQ